MTNTPAPPASSSPAEETPTPAPLPAPPAAEQAEQRSGSPWRKVLWAAMLGNAVEWYDNALYGILAVVMSRTFFPGGDPAVALISTYLGLILSYAIRPVGGTLMGRLADVKGHRYVLTVTIVLMSIGTVAIGVLPAYSVIGVAAPVLLALCRLVQGLGASAEYTVATNFLLEHGPRKKRNYLSGWAVGSTSLGPLIASVLAYILIVTLPSGAFNSWGWRLLFLLAAPLSLVTLYIRRHTTEAPEYQRVLEEAKNNQVEQTPFREAVRGHWRDMLRAIGLGAGQRVGSFMIQSYFVTALVQNGFGEDQALLAAILTYVVGAPAAIWGGWIADKHGGKRLLVSGYGVFVLFTVPTFLAIESGSFALAFVAVVVFTVINNVIGGPLTTAYVMSFPAHVRGTAAALNYNLGTTLLGGTAPLLASWLVGTTGTEVSFGWYMAAICLGSALVAAFALPKAIDALREPAAPEAAPAPGGTPAPGSATAPDPAAPGSSGPEAGHQVKEVPQP
ncbi:MULTISPECIES: MFS transporter [unclassified Streptomyces]|uniref:MFS transporter n=1 Tax=unclassified Streptomyces TaxID=2593676 RepID=UPI002DD9219D|nr:MFS transporter [Streptomyces sp. NBC_01795]WSA91309.1 MFS transporter [Streptomyces sp. NBC_01795]WSS44901.1 MFS transporter [Streptomyces sp. NBC_01187]